jgi:organic hydroperoxide reductase OsmC/OhrA
VKQHTYQTRIDWTGNDGLGTSTYTGYRRDFSIVSSGKPEIPGSSDPSFRGDPKRYNPEELLVATLSSCHMLWYLHLCSAKGIAVLEYRDEATGVMNESPDGSGAFAQVQLNPRVRISNPGHQAIALSIHEDAHRMCFIAHSVNFPVNVAPELL